MEECENQNTIVPQKLQKVVCNNIYYPIKHPPVKKSNSKPSPLSPWICNFCEEVLSSHPSNSGNNKCPEEGEAGLVYIGGAFTGTAPYLANRTARPSGSTTSNGFYYKPPLIYGDGSWLSGLYVPKATRYMLQIICVVVSIKIKYLEAEWSHPARKHLELKFYSIRSKL